MANKYFEFDSLSAAKSHHARLTRLGWRPFSIFRTNDGKYAFHIA